MDVDIKPKGFLNSLREREPLVKQLLGMVDQAPNNN